MAERRIILVGKIGSGKSATGNTILMRKRFPISTHSQDTFKTECSLRQALNKSTKVTYHVFDTPGIADEYGILPEKGYMVQQQMVQYCDKPHVFLLIVDPAGCDHVMEMITALKTWFGMTILDRTILVFTKGTTFIMDESFHSFVRKGNLLLVKDLFGSRMIKIENHGEGRSKSRRILLSLIDSTCHNGTSSFLVTPKPRYIFYRGINKRRTDTGTVQYAKAKQRESLDDIPIASGTEPPRGLNQWTQRERINALFERSDTKVPNRPTECDFDHGDIYTRPTPQIIEIHNEDTEPNVQFEKPQRKPENATTNTSFENDAYIMNKEYDLKTQINHETHIVPTFEAESRETVYLCGTKPKASSQTDITPRKPLQREDIHRTLDCESGTTNTSFENDAYRINKEDDLKTQINHETQIVPRFEGECRETEYLYVSRPKASSQTEITPRKPLQREDLNRTLECAFHAGRAVTRIKTSPLTSIAQLALIARNEENVEAIKNVVNSEEVQIAVENTWSFLKEAAIGVGNFVSEVAQEIEKNRRRQLQLEEERKRRSTHMHYYTE